MISAILYIAAVLAANYTATMFLPFPVFGQVSIGTIIFGVTFTQRDKIHALGRRAVYATIAVAALLCSVESVLMDVPARIILASFVAIILSEAADTEVFQHLTERSWALRVVSSNAVSIPLDSLLFNLIAFYGVFSSFELSSIIFGEIVTKTLVSWAYAAWVRPRSAAVQPA